MSIPKISVAQYFQFVDDFATDGWDGKFYEISDIPQNIEGLDIGAINAAVAVGLVGITSKGPVQLTVLQAIALEAQSDQAVAMGRNNISITAPSVTISDKTVDIHSLGLDQLDELQSIGVTAIGADDLSASPISVATYQAAVKADTPFTSPVKISGSAAQIEKLTPDQINAAASLGLGRITVTGNKPLVILDVAQALALEEQVVPITVPKGGIVEIADVASNLVKLTTDQIGALPFIGVSEIAAADTPAVFSAAQMTALGKASVVVVAPPIDPTQNLGSMFISDQNGGGLSFDIQWDPSVASAPAGFEAGVEAAFQFYANLIANPITLYYTVGYGEAGGSPVPPLAENHPEFGYNGNITYSNLVSALNADAISPAQKQAYSALPLTDPTGGLLLDLPWSEEAALSGTNPGSLSTPDDTLGVSDTSTFDFSADPEDVAGGMYGFVGVVEHEISEGMGRTSDLNNNGAGGPPTQYSPIDLFRYAGSNNRQLTTGAPSYFSIDGGATDLDDWNNFKTGNSGDLADWAPSAGHDSYDDNNQGGPDPVTPTDILLMNVLGYDINPVEFFTAAYIEALTPSGIAILASVGIYQILASDTSLLLTAAQVSAFQTADIQLSTPIGDTITVIDTLANLQSLTSANLTTVSALILSDMAGNIEAISAQEMLQFPGFQGLGITEIKPTDTAIAFNMSQVLAIEADGIPVAASPAGQAASILDSSQNIEKFLTPSAIAALGGVGITGGITSNNGSLAFSIVQALALINANVPSINVPTGDTVGIADTASDIEALSANPTQLTPFWALSHSNAPLILTATDAPIVLTLDQALAFAGAPFRLADTQGVIVTVTPLQTESLTVTTIDQLAALGFNQMQTSNGSGQFGAAEIAALVADGITVQTAPLIGPQIISDSAPNIAGILTQQVIEALPSLSPDVFLIESTTGTITFDVQQIQAIVAEPNTTSISGAGFAVADIATQIAKLTPDQLTAMTNTDALFPVPVTVTQGSELDLSAQQAATLSFFGPFGLSFRLTGPQGMSVAIDDSAPDIKALTPTQLADLENIDVSAINADASLSLNVAQAEAYGEEAIGYISVPTHDTVTIADDATKITAFLDLGATDVELVSQFDSLNGITSSGPIALTVSEAETLETANATLGKDVAITATSGTVTLSDSAANIAAMSAAQLAALPSIGITAIDATGVAAAAWANDASGNWATATNWTPQAVPGAADAVTIAAAGAAKYTVKSSQDVTVFSIALGATATLDLTGGTFTAASGTGTGTNAGVIKLGAGATLVLSGGFDGASTGQIMVGNAATGGAQLDLDGADVDGGKLTIAAGSSLDATGGAPSTITGGTLSNAGDLSAISGSLTIDEAVSNTTGDIAANGGNVAILGKLTNAGIVEVDDGSGIVDNTLTVAGTVANNGGSIELLSDGNATTLALDGAVTLTGSGDVTLSDVAPAVGGGGTNQILSNGEAATITNINNTMSGSGSIGDGDSTLTLNNRLGGTIDANGANGLTIDTGNPVVNAGLLEATNIGGLSIDDAVTNTGTIAADGGNVIIGGNLTGSGPSNVAEIFSGNQLELKGTSNSGAISFQNNNGDNSLLILDHSVASAGSTGFKGTVAGLSFDGTKSDTLDLQDIAFAARDTWSFNENANGQQGVLTVKDTLGDIAKITLLGQYLAAGAAAASASSSLFHLAADTITETAGTLVTTTFT